MVSERVPRELAHEPMILVEIVPVVREDDVRLDVALQALEEPLDVLTAIRDASGSLVGYAKVTRDLTLRRDAVGEGG